MKLFPRFLLVFGFTTLLLGGLFWMRPQTLPANQAKLPVNHPLINQVHALGGTSLVEATPNDFLIPGTPPHHITETIIAPENCTFCHGTGYSQQTGQAPETETWFAWQGSMMAQSGRDPLFYAALDIANADVAGSGEYCLRCHVPRGWLDGRSIGDPTGNSMTAQDLEGVQCEVCHRMVDPVYTAENPDRDQFILDNLPQIPPKPGNAMMVIDTADYRRGPLNINDTVGFDIHKLWNDSQDTLQSPFHTEAALCGTCHDISNPLLAWDEAEQEYTLHALDTPLDDLSLAMPVETTYSEWLYSDYNSTEGVYAPQFGGNQEYVATCQDCHMRNTTGTGGHPRNNIDIELRDNYPLHDMTGANTWVPETILDHPTFGPLFEGENNQRHLALEEGIDRARYMIQNAATLTVTRTGDQLNVTVVNQSGHRLPTGYIEGRRMWLQVVGYNEEGEIIYTSGWYDVNTADLTHDPDLKLYHAEGGITEDLAAQLGLPAGPSFHFMLNNVRLVDNRIPPRGYTFANYNSAGAAPYTDGQPDPTLYADGQYWDTTSYTLPEGVAYGTVRLLHQVASKEYIEFLRDNNPNGDGNRGELMYDLWEMNAKSCPEVMVEKSFDLNGDSGTTPTEDLGPLYENCTNAPTLESLLYLPMIRR